VRRSATALASGSSQQGALGWKGLFGLTCLCVIALVTFLVGGPANAAAADACSNESLRSQSNLNPTTGQPYSTGLAECRAYEMVSPLDKQAHEVHLSVDKSPVSAAGDEVGFESIGNFADPDGSNVGGYYASQRSDSGWTTHSTLVPDSLISEANVFSGGMSYSADLSEVTFCGDVGPSNIASRENVHPVTCARRTADGSWLASPSYVPASGSVASPNQFTITNLGGSSDLSDIVFQSNAGENHLLPNDSSTAVGANSGSLYEIAGLGGPTPTLRLVNVDNAGALIGPATVPALGGGIASTRYQAVSADGSTIYFTATPTGGVATVYARQNGTITTAVSNPTPAECTVCSPTPAAATYQGASSDGSRVYFTTTQELTDADSDSTSDLYEYDFDSATGHHVVQVSAGGTGDATPGIGAQVKGVLRTSADGSHAYFVASGVLTTLPNGSGQTATLGANNLYAFQRDAAHPAGATSFIGSLPSSDSALWGVDIARQAETTPDGRYLVFVTTAKLTADDTDTAADAYRYDSQTGALARVSGGAPGSSDTGNTAEDTVNIGSPPGVSAGAYPDINELGRSISDDGSTIAFATVEALSADDVNDAYDIYAWREGTGVSMISDGHDPLGANARPAKTGGSGTTSLEPAAMSPSGSDIFFSTRTQLTPGDQDQLKDVYDARIGGGLPAPPATPSCIGEACQAAASGPPSFGAPTSTSLRGAGNVEPSGKNTAATRPKIVGHRVKGKKITISVRAPGSGRLTTSGSDITKVARSVQKAGKYTLELRLTAKARKRLASLKHGEVLVVKVRVSFAPSGSATPSSSATSISVKA
jgi:WD40-like Beta Propeller Repeat